jgi:transposase
MVLPKRHVRDGVLDGRAARHRIGRAVMTSRAGRWVTEQVGRLGRAVAEVARELGCDWHTVNDTVIAYGRVLVDDPSRIRAVTALGMNEILFLRDRPYRTQRWATSIVDVRAGQLLDVVAGRNSTSPARWLAVRGDGWCAQVKVATLDPSGPYRAVFNLIR